MSGRRHRSWAWGILPSGMNRGRESLLLPLPPNRTGGSPAYGSPVGGFTWLRIDEWPHQAEEIRLTSHDTCSTVSPRGVVNMRNFDRHSVFRLATPEAVPTCLARGHSRWLRFCLDRRYSSTSLPPLAPPRYGTSPLLWRL